MAYITFNDGSAATLEPYPSAGHEAGQRFRSWEPFQRPFGEGSWALGDGRRYQFSFRTDYGASFELPGIPNTDVDIAMRLQAHLLGGGSCAVYTLDANGATYATCYLAPDSDVTIELEDRQTLEYVVRLSLINAGGARMLCEY